MDIYYKYGFLYSVLFICLTAGGIDLSEKVKSSCSDSFKDWAHQFNDLNDRDIVSESPEYRKLQFGIVREGLNVVPCLLTYMHDTPHPAHIKEVLTLFEFVIRAPFIQLTNDEAIEDLDFSHSLIGAPLNRLMVLSKPASQYDDYLVDENNNLYPATRDDKIVKATEFWENREDILSYMAISKESELHKKIPFRVGINDLRYDIKIARALLLESRYGVFNLPRYISDVQAGENGIIFREVLRITSDFFTSKYHFLPTRYLKEATEIAVKYPTKEDRMKVIHDWWKLNHDQYELLAPSLADAIDKSLHN